MLWTLLFLALGGSVPADAELLNRRDELVLLHQRVSLSGLRLWNPGTEEWRPAAGPEISAGGLLVVHIWADWCRPCIEEFPWLKAISGRLQGDDVRFVFIAESPSAAREMKKFLQEHPGLLPPGPVYQGTGLLPDLPVRRLPLTLLLDAELGVRQAFIGSIKERRSELVDSIARLRQHLRTRGPAEATRGMRRMGP